MSFQLQVWLDDYAKYYYERIGNDKGEYGNLSSRFELRKKLKCKPFKWYIDNVYPQIEMPDKYVASGQVSAFKIPQYMKFLFKIANTTFH